MLSEKQARLGALQRQAERLQRREQALDARSDRYSWIRLAIFVAGIVQSVLAAILMHTWWAGITGVALTILLYTVVAYIHGQIEASLARHRVLLAIRRIQIARITLHWPAIPSVSTGSSRMDHPFDTDLDITGEHSLHRLLNSATSREGSARLCAFFFRERDHSPSQLLKRLSRLVSAASLNRNPALFLLLNALVPCEFFIASRLEHHRSILAHSLPAWLDTWFELEALCSLATFAYLNPEYTLPEVDLDSTETSAAARTVCFEAEALGHPLIPAESKVVNDFALPRLGEMVIITGSNMSGKSTFLRALGINLCLAYAGGPVDARTLRSGLFRLMTCIRVNDSVTGGYSYFYAEVRRLKTLLTALQQPDSFPVFFLIDEIFKGTNNRERLIGSRSYLRALVVQPCLGAISTHDLDLVRLAETVPQVANYHFREEVVHGEMTFDYLLRPGPCPTTNALKIMQMEGLPVEPAG